MAHDVKNLTVYPSYASYGSGGDKVLTKADNITADTAAVIEAAGYFNASASRLPKNTVITSISEAGLTTPKLKEYIVIANTGTVVTIALLTTTAG